MSREKLNNLLIRVAFPESPEDRYEAESAIEAMLARAWDEGADAALECENAYGAEEKAKYSNPYRNKPDNR